MTKDATPPKVPEIAGKIYELLEPLDGSTRTKVLQGALGMLGDPAPDVHGDSSAKRGSGTGGASLFASGAKARAWLQKHSITDEALEHMFHLDNGQVDLIANPGATKREQTINTYLLVGVKHLLQSDDPKFSEPEAVALCKRLGCFDRPNHATT